VKKLYNYPQQPQQYPRPYPQYYPQQPQQYPRPYPQYYPRQTSNIGKVLLGLGVVAGIGVGAWYLYNYFFNGNGNGKTCPDYSNETDCAANGCNWCNGQCQSTHCGQAPCQYMGSCYPNIASLRKCDNYNNLCECTGSEWVCIEQESNTCVTNQSHFKCYANADGQVICVNYAGQGTDQCTQYYPDGCPCNPPATWCQEGYFCEPVLHRCIEEAYSLTISATTSNMECWNEDIGGGQVRSHCVFSLDKAYAAILLSGNLYFKWGPIWPGETCYWQINGMYSGEESVLGSGNWHCSEPDGNIFINPSFIEQGIEALHFMMDSGSEILSSNIHIDKFIGHLSD